MSAPADTTFLAAIERIATEVAAPNATAVDQEARFPGETIDAMRAEQLLSAFVPAELGGAGVSFEAVAEACLLLGRNCGAAAMVYAMHQIQIVTIVRHLDDAPWFEEYLKRVVAEQRLVASVTSELGTGGDMGRSVAAVTPADDGTVSFSKQAPTVSYGRHADDLFVT
ncbi:MAG: acyl-CoA dehydrogenase, partial [Solirubrobacteraceae bacterium]|nr:acyl-CoA dehydrogenase [Solirubrobacteraceae bacterium]